MNWLYFFDEMPREESILTTLPFLTQGLHIIDNDCIQVYKKVKIPNTSMNTCGFDALNFFYPNITLEDFR